MKRFIFLSIVIIGTLSSYAQRLTLTDLTNLCNKKNWEDVNQILLSKNWSYYDSEKGSTLKYNTITWSFNKEYYSDKAQAWFYLFTYEGFPNKISYSVFNKESYTLIQNSLSTNGFKLTNSEIEDNEVISTYSNQNYTLKISTQKRDDDDWSSRSVTAYNITLIKKAGIYDPDNGAKTDYYYDGYSIQAEYTLKNGLLNGTLKSYYQNGNLKKTGNYINGKENGLFKEYNEDGSISIEYNMKNGEMNGAFKTYYENGQVKKTGSFLNGKGNGNFKEYAENGDLEVTYSKINDEYDGLLTIYEAGKVAKKINYKNGERDGLFTEFTYGDNDTLLLEYSGLIKNELKDGVWNLYLYRDGKKEIAEFTTFKNDIKEGNFKKVQGDSLIFGSYINDRLNGNYIVYIDLVRTLFGGIIRTDSTGLNLQSKGEYSQGNKSGYWSYYSFGKKVREGHYWNGLMDGEWKYYYPNYVDEKGNNVNYSGQLYLIESYESDKLNGESIRYSYIDKEKVLCDTILNKNVNPLDTCTKSTWIKCYESSFYKNDLLHGPYTYKDSTGNIRMQGNYINGKKDGAWIESYLNDGLNNEKYIVYQEGYYSNDKREGKWIEYVTKEFIWNEFYYSSGKLNGKYYSYNKDKTPREIKTFEYDKFKTLSVYDSTGTKVIRKFEILKETDGYLKVRKTEYNSENTISLEYYMKKDEPELNHNFFEIIFAIKSGKLSNGEDCYPDGLLTLLDNNGNKILFGNLLKKNRIGVWNFNYPEQNVQIQVEYSNGEPGTEKYFVLNTTDLFNGTFVYNDTETGLREERKIKDGLRNGKTVYIDITTGKTTKKEKYEDGKIK